MLEANKFRGADKLSAWFFSRFSANELENIQAEFVFPCLKGGKGEREGREGNASHEQATFREFWAFISLGSADEVRRYRYRAFSRHRVYLNWLETRE